MCKHMFLFNQFTIQGLTDLGHESEFLGPRLRGFILTYSPSVRQFLPGACSVQGGEVGQGE